MDFTDFFFFKQKTAYVMRISDWSSDVCSSDLSSPPARPPMSPARRSTSTAVFALFCREGGATLRPEVVCGYRQRRQLGGSGFLLQSFQLDAALGHSMLQALRPQAAPDLAGHQDFPEALRRGPGATAAARAAPGHA